MGLATFTTLALAHKSATGVVKKHMDPIKGQQENMKLKKQRKGEIACVSLFSRTSYLERLV